VGFVAIGSRWLLRFETPPEPGRNLILAGFALFCLKNFFEDVPTHLFWRIDLIDAKNRRRKVIHRGFKTHQAETVFDSRPHREERSGNIVAVREVVFGNHRRRFFVIHMCMGVGLFKFAQRLDAVIGNDEEIRVVINVLQNRAQHLIEGDVL